jgi:ArsR family transcriptional regulator, nickel/cobalt-responsive transcriptional repressor
MADPKKIQPKRCANMLKAVADPERLRIIQHLRGGPKNVSELAVLLKVELFSVSHHLGVLRQAGLVCDEKQGRFVVYRLNPRLFHPTDDSDAPDSFDFGCCRLELPEG